MTGRAMLAMGTGVGIRILGQDLQVTVARVRPTGIRVLGSTVIPAFRQRPAAEWGAEYTGFLRRAGAGHLAATVLLPRTEVIVRQVALPGVAHRDLASAVPLQIDALHPYGEDEAGYAWARLPESGCVLVGIARKAAIERYSSLFVEAGIKIAAFTFSAAVLYAALRILADPPADGFLAIGGEMEMEAYGESPARPVLSAVLDQPLERSAALAASELRLDAEARWLELAEVLPQPKAYPADFDLRRAALSYATALAGACFRPALKANLLPAGLRSSNSRVILAPTVALAVILVALAAALAAQAPYQERRQLALLRAEIGRFEPLAKKADAARKAADLARSRVQVLNNFQRRTRADLDALQELTRLLEPPAWLQVLEMNGETVTINGQAEQAPPLLKLLDGSPLFRASEFVGQIQKADKNEVFRVRMVREGVAR